MILESSYKRLKNGMWEYRANGKSATGVSKESARGNYYMLYEKENNNKNFGYDQTKIDKTPLKLGGI